MYVGTYTPHIGIYKKSQTDLGQAVSKNGPPVSEMDSLLPHHLVPSDAHVVRRSGVETRQGGEKEREGETWGLSFRNCPNPDSVRYCPNLQFKDTKVKITWLPVIIFATIMVFSTSLLQGAP